MTALRVLPPRDAAAGAVQTAALFAALAPVVGPRAPVTVWVAAGPRDVGWWLQATEDARPAVEAAVRAAWPGADVVDADPPDPPAAGVVSLRRWRARRTGVVPLVSADRPAPVTGLVRTLSAVAARDGFAAVRMTLLGASGTVEPVALRALCGVLDATVSGLAQVVSTAPPAAADPPLPHLALLLTLRTVCAGADPEVVRFADTALHAALARLAAPDGRGLRSARRVHGSRLALTTLDLGVLVQAPGPEEAVPHLPRAGARRFETCDRAAEAVRLGTSPLTGEPVGVPVPTLLRHAYVIGPTGSGKTALLTRLVLGLRAHGVGAVVVDPDGDLTRQLLGRLPAEQLPRTRVLDLGDPANLPTVNPLWVPALPDRRAHEAQVVQRVNLVRDVFAAVWELDLARTPQLLHVLDTALHTLVRCRVGSLAQLYDLLANPTVRRRLLARVDDPVTQSRWAELERKSGYERGRIIDSTLNKVGVFSWPLLGTVFGDTGPGLRFAEVLDTDGLLLVHLPVGRLGADVVRLVGGIVVTMLGQAARDRHDRPARPVVAVLDEFQELGLTGFGDLLTATRKYGLGLVVANQNLATVRAVGRDLLSTLLANVSTVAAFGLGAEDARVLAAELHPVTTEDLLSLPPHELYLRRDGRVLTVAADDPGPLLRDPESQLAASRLPGVPMRLSEGDVRGSWQI